MADTTTQPKKQVSNSETHSKNVLGPVSFTLCDLRLRGLAEASEVPSVAPDQSPYIIASNEPFEIEVDVEFNRSPLTSLLLCLGTKMTVCFSFEGIGAKAVEIDLEEAQLTYKDVYKYTLTWKGTPEEAGLTAGFYGIAAVATIGPVEHPCAPKCAMGYGYIAGLLLQVYEAFDCH
ncbi:MAG: hypothetical protein WBA57_26520 [Elainellaceae cyanobacterium]